MYNNGYTAFAHNLRARSSFPYYSSPPDHDLLHNPCYIPSTYQRLPLITGQQFPRQSALLYFAPSRTFIAAAATYLATTRRPRAGLSGGSGSISSCCVTVRETRCCHSHCFCDGTRTSFRETRSCNRGRGQKILGREVIQARQVWRCDEDYECECGRSELIERDLRRKERSVEPRVSNNARIEECFDYREIDNSRQRDDEARKFNQMRRHRCECDCEDDEQIRLTDQRRRGDEYDYTFSDRRRRGECDDYVDDERVRLSNRRRRRDEYDDNVRFSDPRRRAAYDDYDEREDVRNREDRIKVSSRMEMEEYDLGKADDYRGRRDDQIKFIDRKRDNRIKVSDQRRRDGSYDIHEENRVRVSDRRRKDEYYDYDEEDKVRVSDQRRRDNYNERSNNIRVSDRRKDESYDYDEEDYRRREEDRIRVSDRRRREVDDEKDDKIKVFGRRRRDEYYDFDDEDRVRVSDRRRNNGYYDYDNEDNIRVSDRRRKDVRYDYDGEDRVGVSDRRRSAGYYDYDHGDDIRISDRKRSDRHYDYDNEDNIRVSDRRRRNVYYDYDDEDRVIVTDRRRKDVSDERDNSLRVIDNRRRDEHYDYNEDDRIRVSDQRRRDEDYDFTEEDKIRVYNQKRKEVLNSKDNRIHNSDNRIREEADDYEQVFTDLQRRGNAARVSDSKLERQSRFKESRDEASTSQIRQTEEREGKYREKREHFDQKSLKEGSQYVKIISEDDSSLLSRERKNAVNKLDTSEAQLNLQRRTQIGMQRQNVDSSSLVESQAAMQKDKKNTLNQFTVSEVETNVQNRTHIGTDRKQVETTSSVQNQVQVIRDKKNFVNQLTVNETQLDLQLRSNVDVQRKMVDESSTVQNVNQVVRNKENVQNQLTISEAESDVQNRTRIEAERRRVDTSTSVQDMTQVVRGKHNIVNPPLTMSELESNIQEINRIEAEKRRVDLDTSVQNVTQIGRQKQELVDQLAVSEVESNLQNRSQTEAERRVVDTASTIQNVTEVTNEKNNVVNQLTIHETEVNVLNETDINLTRVHVNDASTHIDNLSTGTGSETSTALIQQTEISSGRVGSSSLAAGLSSFKGSLESASQLEKSSSYHVGRFVDSVHEELLSGSAKKSPSESLSDPKSSGAHGTFQTAAGTETENTVARRQGKSLWAFVADIMKLGFLKDEARQSRSGRRSSSSGSRGTDDWFSGQEEVDTETKNEDEQPSIENPPETDPSALVKDPEVDLTATDDGTVIPTLQEKTVVEDVRGHESTSIIGETDNLSSTTTSELHGSGVVGSTFSLGETIVKEEIPMIARQTTEKRTKGGYSSDMQASIAGGSSMLETHVSGTTETSDRGESKRRMQLKRTMQVPKSSFDEWEEEHSTQIETPAIDYAGGVEGLASGVAGVSDVSTSLGSAILGFQPSRVSGQPSASAFSASAAWNLDLSGDTGIETAGGLRMEKQLKRIARVQSKSIDEYEETKMGENTTSTTDSTVVITELPESGAVEGHEIVDKGGRKHLRRLSQVPRESFEEWEEAYIREKEQRRLDEFFMREALVEAQRASDSWEVPVGAVLVRNGEVIARGCNLVEELRDSTAHAEMVCIREASNLLHSWRLSDTTLYVTLEPCAMCAGAILQARVDTVVWGAPNKLLGADGSWVRLFPGDAETSSSLNPPPVQQTGPVHPFHPKITIRRGILEDECSEIMQQFFKLRRKKKSTKPDSSSNKPSNPLKFFSRFTGMFCV